MCAAPARHRASRKVESGPVPRFWAAEALLESGGTGRPGKHARRGPSRYALHVGRVGALAVSLGVGLAVANSAAVAYADTDTDVSVSKSKSSPSTTDREDPAQNDGDDDPVDDDSQAEDGDADDEDADSGDGELPPEDDPELEPSGQAPLPADDAEEPASDSAGDTDDPQDAPTVADPAAAPRDPDLVPAQPPVDTGAATNPTGNTGQAGDVAVVDVTAPALTDPAEQTAQTPEERVQTVDLVSALVSTVISPFADPDAPAQVPWFDALLAWVRRQVNHTFFNRTPVYGPITTEQILTGQLLIDLKASDPNGDPLVYEIIQPTHGLVYRDLITGKFVYTPTAIVSGSPLQDSFQVVIRDDSEHLTGGLGSIQRLLHGVARLFGLAQKDNVTVTVPVTIGPIVQLPPAVVTVGLPVFALGGSPVKVLSSAIITDADSDRISRATIRIATSGQDGDILKYVAPEGSPITATWDAASKTLTLTGLATADQYEQALLAVTFSTTQGGLPRGLSIAVTDEEGVSSLVPGAALVTVLGLPPVIATLGAPIFRLGGSAVQVVSSVTITDADSGNLSKATLTIGSASFKAGDVLKFTAIQDNPIVGTWDAETRTLTLSGVATIDQYEAAIKAVTFSTTEGGLPRAISIGVTDETDKQSLVPGAALVTVLGLPPVIATLGAPIFRLGGSAVQVVSSVTITDADSGNLSKATLTIGSASFKAGDVLKYTAIEDNPIVGTWDAETRTLTLTGVATIDQYEAAIKAVTFTTTEGGLPRAISIGVVDETDKHSLVPGAALVTVLGLPPVIATLGAPIFRLGGSAVQVVSSVTITDADSGNLSKATLTIGSASFKAGDVLKYTAIQDNPIVGTWDAATRTLTLSGVATIDQYEAAIKAVTFTTTEGGLPRSVSVSVVDETDKQSLVPGAALVTVIGLPPAIATIGAPIFRLGGSAVQVVSSVTITDADSGNLSKATLTIGSASFKAGDVLKFTAIQDNPIVGTWDAETRTLTLTGVATIDQYEAAIKAVTFTTTEGGLPRAISIGVVDETDKQSLVPGAALVTVLGLPPAIATIGAPIFRLGGSAVQVVSSVTITDADSGNLSKATLTIGSASFKAGDVLKFTAIQDNPIVGTWDAETRTLTLSGVATIDQYEAAIKAVTFSTTEGGLPRAISIGVTDETDKQSLVPGAALVTVLGLPPVIATLGAPIFRLGGSAVQVVSSVTITDADSGNLSKATLTIGSASFKAGDVLKYTAIEDNPIVGSWDAETRTLTLSGVATIDQYEAAIKAVTFTATEGGLPRAISIGVVDETDKESLVPGAALVTVLGLPPVIATLGAPIFRLGGSPVQVVSSVIITDADSGNLSKATLTIGSGKAADVLKFTAIEDNPIVGSWDAATRTLTLSGVATIEQYEAAIKAVTFTATEGGLPRSVSVSVVDETDKQSLVPGVALVTVLGLPPVIATLGAPIFRLGGSPVQVVSSVTITDADSGNLSKATLTIGSGKAADILKFTAIQDNPIVGTWDAETRTLTLAGVATIDQYEAAIKAVTFTTTEGGLPRAISIGVTDETDKQSLVPGAALVTVIGLPPAIATLGAPIFRLGGSPVTVVSSVTITDADSGNLSKATLTIGSGKAADILKFTAIEDNPIAGTWDAETRTLTLTGVATIDQYEAAIKAVTFTTTEGGLPRAISIGVVDETDKQSLVPGAALVTVIGLPPAIATLGAPIFRLGGSPVTVVSSVTITDADSGNLSKATLTIGEASFKTGDILKYTAIQDNPIVGTWDAETRTLTLEGVATIDQYEAAIKAVTFSTTEGGLPRSVSVSVVDETDKQSLVPGAALVTVIGLPPAIATIGAPIFRLGGSPVTVVSSVTITDADSGNLSKATLTIGSGKAADILKFTAIEDNPIVGTWDAETRTLTLSGVATIDQYEAAIKAVTFSTTEGGLPRSVSVSVVDETDKQSLVPGAALVTVLGLPPVIATLGAPIFRLGGSAVQVVSSVTITDADSGNLSKATLTIGSGKAADTLKFTAIQDNPIVGTWDAETRTLTLTGVATIDQYEQAIKAVTFTTTEGGLPRSVSVSVVDETDKHSLVPGAALVTVIGLPPVIATIGAPIFRLGGSPVTVVSSVTITDADSGNLSKATLTIGSASFKTGDVLKYTAIQDNPIVGTWDAETRTLTLTGVATIDQYEAAIKAVTFSTTEGGLPRSVSVSVVDETDKQSLVPGAALVTVLGLPPVIATLGAPIFRLGGSAVQVVSSVTITDADSGKLSKATLTIGSASFKAGDVLKYTAIEDNPIVGTWDAETRTLTLSGVATIDQYEQAIKTVTFSTTEGGLPRAISIGVTDETDKQSLVPGAALVTVIGLPPAIATIGAPIFRLGGSPVPVVSSVTITDADSGNLSKATLTIGSGKAADILKYTAIQDNPIVGTWDAETRTLTLEGVATIEQYEAAIKAVTFTTTEGGLSRAISIGVTDETDKQSLVPGAALVTVIGLPPAIATIGAPIFRLGGSPVTVVSSVTITDADSGNLSKATLTIGSASFKAGDVLKFTAIQDNPIVGTWDAETRTLTLTGVATIDQYEAAIKAVTFSTTEGGLPRSVSVSVVDETDKQSLVPGAALVTVLGLPPAIATIGAPIFRLGGSPVTVVSSVTITDADSGNLSKATLTIGSGKAADILKFTAIEDNPIVGTWDAETRTLTFTGAATIDQYEAAIKAVTFSTTEGGLPRSVSVSVVDETDKQSLVPGAALVTVIGLPPAIATIGAPIFRLGGSPVTVVSSVTITDADSGNLSKATLTIGEASFKTGDILKYTAIQDNPIVGTWDAETRTLTLTGVATIDQYEAAIKAVTFTASQGGLPRGIQIDIIDESDVNSDVRGSALVTVVGLPPSVTTIGAATYTIGTSPVKLLATVSIADADSDNMSRATVRITSLGQTGDVLNYVPQQNDPISANWDAATRTLTLSGTATKAQYEAALEAVTFAATGGPLIVRGISVSVVDDTGVEALLPGAATANVRYSLAPSVVTAGASTHTIGTSPVKLLSSAAITDADSDKFSSATVTISSLGQTGDTLGYVQPSGNPITASWNAGTRTLTLTGVGTAAQYEEALEAVTFSATGGVGVIRGFTISVADDTGVSSSGLLNGAAVAGARENSAPGLWITGGGFVDRNETGFHPVVTLDITDDLGYLSGATLKISSLAQSNDTLGYVAPEGNPVTATWHAASKTLTMSGTATVEQYEQALFAVTFWANQGFLVIRGITVAVTDSGGKTSNSGYVTVNVT